MKLRQSPPKLTFPSREDLLVPCDCCNNKLGCFKQHTFILPSSGGQKSDVSFTGLKSRCLQGNVPPEAPVLDSLPCFFHFWRLSSFLGSWPLVASPFPPLLPWPPCLFLSSNLFLPPSCMNNYDYIQSLGGQSRIISLYQDP